jgi:predicted nucleic acid-binding protein
VAAHRLPWVSSRILRGEALRAALSWSSGRLADTRRLLNTVTSLSVDLLCDSAGLLPAAPGRRLGTLDALHLATAISLGGDLYSLLTYDQQVRDAALAHNLSVASPT